MGNCAHNVRYRKRMQSIKAQAHSKKQEALKQSKVSQENPKSLHSQSGRNSDGSRKTDNDSIVELEDESPEGNYLSNFNDQGRGSVIDSAKMEEALNILNEDHRKGSSLMKEEKGVLWLPKANGGGGGGGRATGEQEGEFQDQRSQGRLNLFNGQSTFLATEEKVFDYEETESMEGQRQDKAVNIISQGLNTRQVQKPFDDLPMRVVYKYSDRPADSKTVTLFNEFGINAFSKKGTEREGYNANDFYIYIDNNVRIYGLFDGDGPFGPEIATLVKFFFANIFEDQFTKDPDERSSDDLDVAEFLKKSFRKVQSALAVMASPETRGNQEFDSLLSGVCVSINIQKDGYLYTATCGNIKSILSKSKIKGLEAIQLTPCHVPSDFQEKKRIFSSGGEVRHLRNEDEERVFYRGKSYPGLKVTRAIGHSLASKIGLISKPEIAVREIGKTDSFIIMSSPSLWEFNSEMNAISVVDSYGIKNIKEAGEMLAQNAWNHWVSHDNLPISDLSVLIAYLI